MATYKEKLLDPRWQKKRLKVLERDNFTCQYCGSDKNSLQIHHYKYIGDPWEAPIQTLITLCCKCHSEFDRAWKHNMAALPGYMFEDKWTPDELYHMAKLIEEYPTTFRDSLKLMKFILKDKRAIDRAKKLASNG